MADHLNITDFLTPLNLDEISHNEGFKEGQLGKNIAIYDQEFPDLDDAQIVLLGCGEQRGSGIIHIESNGMAPFRIISISALVGN